MRVLRSALRGLIIIPIVAGCSDDPEPLEPVNEPPVVRILQPAGGAAFVPGAVVDIVWEATDPDGDPVTVNLDFVADFQPGVTAIATALPASGSHRWTTPTTTLFGVRVRATATDAGGLQGVAASAGPSAIVAHSERGYVTSLTCRGCHTTNYNAVRNSGHPYKINKVVNARAPTYPAFVPPPPGTPAGFTWSTVSYVIGGYGYKTRFMDLEGYIITNGFNKVNSQYNMPRPDLSLSVAGGSWGSYEGGDPKRKPYTCGGCHTTGWQTFAENGGRNQDGLRGILGTWEEPGVSCEACHGPGVKHVATQKKADIDIDRNAESCGSCHFRDTNHRILASGGFIRHHEQYDEMIAAGHAEQSCTGCHDPHIGTRYGNDSRGGIKVTCVSCHATKTKNAHLVPIACESCHMPFAARTAVSQQTYAADIRSHIIKVNPDPVDRSAMFYTEDGVTYARGFLTLDFACWGCHRNPDTGIGGTVSPRSLAELSFKAKNIHTKP